MEENIILHIKSKLDKLSKAEKKIGEYILNHAAKTVQHNTLELAEQADVSPATIIRFCRSIGLSGFSELKIRLYADASGVNKDLYTDIMPDEGAKQISEKLALRFNQSISQTVNHLDTTVIEKVSKLLNDCSTIYICGLGASHIVAEDAMQKFSRIGKTVIHSLDHHLMASSVINTNNPCILIAISNSGETKEILKLTKIAQQNKLYTVGISKDGNSSLTQLVDYPIIHHGGEEVMLRSAATTSLMAQLFIIDVLYFSFMNQNPDQTLGMLKDSKINIQTFFREEDP